MRTERGVALEGPREVIDRIARRAALGPLRFGRARTVRERIALYDTSNGALREAGVSLCVVERSGGLLQRVVEQREPPACGYFERRWSEARVATPEPALAPRAHGVLGARARALCADGDLARQEASEYSFVVRRIAIGGSVLVARFELREASAAAAAASRLEIVRRSGARAAPFQVALALLAAAPELRPARDDVSRASDRLRRPPPAAAVPRRLGVARKAPFATLIEAALVEGVRGFAFSRAALQWEASVERVHETRVAVRRLRATLRLFRAELTRGRAAGLRRALEPLADALGSVRDLDTFLERLAVCRELGAPPLDGIEAAAASARGAALAALERTLDTPATAKLELELGLLAFGGDWRRAPSTLTAPAAEAALALAARADRRTRHAGGGFATLDADARHRLRLRVKSARYVVELFAPLLPTKRTERYLRRARALQDALGAERDALRAREYAARFSASDGARAADFLAGFVAGEAERARIESERAWRRFLDARRPWR